MRDMMGGAVALSNRGARRLAAADLDAVINIDSVHAGRNRRHFFEKRFAAAAAHPDDFLHIGIVSSRGRLCGFAIARILRGEYGHKDAVAVLDAIGVDADSRDRGIGQSLTEELIEALRRRDVRAIHSQASWTNFDLLHFFDAAGFTLAPRVALERPVSELRDEAGEEV